MRLGVSLVLMLGLIGVGAMPAGAAQSSVADDVPQPPGEIVPVVPELTDFGLLRDTLQAQYPNTFAGLVSDGKNALTIYETQASNAMHEWVTRPSSRSTPQIESAPRSQLDHSCVDLRWERPTAEAFLRGGRGRTVVFAVQVRWRNERPLAARRDGPILRRKEPTTMRRILAIIGFGPGAVLLLATPVSAASPHFSRASVSGPSGTQQLTVKGIAGTFGRVLFDI